MSTPPYAELLASLGILLIERQAGRSFTVPGVAPDWFRSFVARPLAADEPIEPGAIFPFLDHFLEDAENFWAAGEPGELRSGFWAEESATGADLQLQAVACHANARDYLLVQHLTLGFERIQHVFQKARELSLTHERLIAEIGKKDILLHCIIHDMSGPLHGMTGALEIASEETTTKDAKHIIDLGLLAAKQQSNLIHDLLDSFRSEFVTEGTFTVDPATAPDVVACAKEILALLKPAFEALGISGTVLAPAGVTTMKIVAERRRLERVFYNLLQNAMRYSPDGGRVTVSLTDEGDFVRIAVDDEGPGVPPEVIPQLFQKFVRHGKSGGKAGLGLFFCRISVEQWGGTIGCEPRVGGGTTFWCRLPKV